MRELSATIRRFAPHLTSQMPRVVLAYATSAIAVLLTLTLPWPLKFLIDDVLTDTSSLTALGFLTRTEQTLILAGAIAILAALTAVFISIEKVLHARIRERFGLTLRDRLIRHIYRLSIFSRQRERSGELTMRLVGDVQLTSRLFCKTLPVALKHIVTAIFTLAVTFYISVTIGGIALLMAVLLGSLVIWFGPKLTRAAKDKRQWEGSAAALAQEMINGIEHIQAMALENQSRKRYMQLTTASLDAGVAEVRVSVRMERAAQIFAGSAVALVAGIGGLMVLNQQLSLGTLTVCIAYMTQLLKPIEKINEIATSVSRGLVRTQRLAAILDAEVSITEAGNAVPDADIAAIYCIDVGYRYPDAVGPVIENFHHVFRRGECTALVGPSGSGKSTILRLMLRIVDPCNGYLSANKTDYASLDPTLLRSQFAVLMQDAHLFAGTIREILVELEPSATDADIYAVLRDVHLDELISDLPQGLETSIDEAGGRISGGQRARLLLARALLSRRPVLILDEPFANIDSVSKRIILSALDRAKTTRILVVVTHERDLLDIADTILTPEIWRQNNIAEVRHVAGRN